MVPPSMKTTALMVVDLSREVRCHNTKYSIGGEKVLKILLLVKLIH